MGRFLMAVCALVCGAWVVRADIPQRVSAILQERVSLSRADVGALDRGRAVARSMKPGDRREIAAAGAVRVGVPVEFFLRQFVDIVSFKRSPIVRQIGKFSGTPRVQDLAPLTFEPGDLDELRRCRVGDCDIQLSADQIRRIQSTVDWSRSDARAQANRVLRELLFEYVERYRTSGNQALLEYANERDPLSMADELRLLVSHSSETLAGVPEFGEALLTSAASLHGAQEFIYWSKEQFGLKPVVSITHVIIYPLRRPGMPDVLIASKQIYASRYLAGSLALTLGVDAPGAPRAAAALGTPPGAGARSFYMAYVSRSRLRGFPPVIGGLVRRIVQGRTRDGLEEQLQLAKDRLEAAYVSAK